MKKIDLKELLKHRRTHEEAIKQIAKETGFSERVVKRTIRLTLKKLSERIGINNIVIRGLGNFIPSNLHYARVLRRRRFEKDWKKQYSKKVKEEKNKKGLL